MKAIERFPQGVVEAQRRHWGRLLLQALDAIGVGPGDYFLVVHPDALNGRAPTPGKCSFCGTAINVNLDYRKVTGWEKRRSEGGTNALALREPHEDEWACTGCIDKLKRGISPAQASLE